MNEVKRSLDAVAGDVSNDKKELKQRVLSGRRKPKRRNPFPAVATVIVMAAVVFLACNVFLGEFTGDKRGAYELNATYYDLLLKNEQFEHPPDSAMRYSLLQQVLYSDSLIEYAKTSGYAEDAQAIEEEVKEQRDSFYNGFTEEQLHSLEQSQLESFGYTYDEYFRVIMTYTSRYNHAVNWLVKHPPENMKTHREVLDSFTQKHEQEISAFMEKKQIVVPSGKLNEIEWDVLVTSVEGDVISAVDALDTEQVKSMSPEQLEKLTSFARFKVDDSVSQIKPFTHITISYDPLSYPINQAESSKFFHDVMGWE